MNDPLTLSPSLLSPQVLAMRKHRRLRRAGQGNPQKKVLRERRDKESDWTGPSGRREQRPPKRRRAPDTVSEDGDGRRGLTDDEIGHLTCLYETPPFDIPKRAYLELCLVVGSLLSGEEGRLSANRIYERLSNRSESQIRDEGGSESQIRDEGGITNVCSVPSALTIETEKYEKTLYRIGARVEEALSVVERTDGSIAQVAEGVCQLVETGEMEPLEQALQRDSSKRRSHRGAGAGSKEEKDSGKESTREEGKTTRSRDTTERREQGQETKENHKEAAGAGRGPVRCNQSSNGNTSQSASSGQKAASDASLPGNRVEQDGELSPKEGTQDGDLRERLLSQSPPVQKKDGSAPEVPTPDKQEEIIEKDPLSDQIPVPKELASALLEWAPSLKEVSGHRAMVQYQLFGTNYNQSRIQGLVLNWQRVAKFYGDTPQMLHVKRDYGATNLIEWYRQEVDSALRTCPPKPSDDLPRVIEETGIPIEIRRLARRVIREPDSFNDWIQWGRLKRGNQRHRKANLRKERLNSAQEQDPVIDPPEPLCRVQDYLNELPPVLFSHGRYGVTSRLPNARRAVLEDDFQSEEARKERLRKLYWLRHHPKPMYLCCDYFPRLKADGYNPLMNLSSQLRTQLYQEGDIEVDIDKAHLSSYVPIAERFGLEVPMLREALKASLEGETDLWISLARQFDHDRMPDLQAGRAAAKSVYSAVYGSSKNNTRHEIIKTYAEETGQWVTGEAVDPVFDHPLMKEIYSVREQIRERIIDQGGMEDAFGRFISLSTWEGRKKEGTRWRGALAYVNASYELSLIWACFQEAIEELEWAEQKKSRHPRFRIWLLQGDGFTVHVDRKRKAAPIIERLKECVYEKAEELDMITGLSVERQGPPS